MIFNTRLSIGLWVVVLGCVWAFSANGLGEASYILTEPAAGSFAVAAGGKAANLCVESADWPGVERAANDLAMDINRVTKCSPNLLNNTMGLSGNMIMIGTIGKSRWIDTLSQSGKIDVSGIRGKWESYIIQTVANPMQGVENALVIVGSDKRGTIYGIYDLSEQMGVSPWYWWGDVPVKTKANVYVKAGKYQQGEPSVKYRGIFLNDEAPALSNWVAAKFGRVEKEGVPANTANYGRAFYTRLFELMLRTRANYLWPAMWNNAFNEDDTENARLADLYGIVMGTSHQEPMLRAQKEWDRGPGRQNGNWNWNNVNQRPVLTEFWRQGVRRNKNYESIFTMGLRAENDSGAEVGKDLTEEIIKIQRQILMDEVNADITKVPQMWCLYKEVQGYYEQGLRVPDDITLLWAEDNWGNVRRLPTADERKRSGGAGIYYHFDYHGGPRSYQWVNSSPIAKIWDQMTLAKEYGADRIWIVNVGHFKGQEFPIEYFMHLGWNSKKWTHENINEFTKLWATREFGAEYAADIADIMAKYTKYNGRRKPELLEAGTYSLVNYNEAETVVADYYAIAEKAKAIQEKLPAEAKDAFYQLVYFPTMACAVVNDLYVSAGKNAMYAQQGRVSANDWNKKVRDLFQTDLDMMEHYNTKFADGKWAHFMDQAHLGYNSWQDPPSNTLRAVRLYKVEPETAAQMGVAVEGYTGSWPTNAKQPVADPTVDANVGGRGAGGARGAGGGMPGRGGPGARGGAPAEVLPESPVLPRFDSFNQQKRWVDVFNRGTTAFEYTATASDPWIVVDKVSGKVEKDVRLTVSIDWSKAPKGVATGSVKIAPSAGGEALAVKIEAFNPAEVTRENLKGFVEAEGYVSIEPEHFTTRVSTESAAWAKIEDYGRTLSAMTILPQTAPSMKEGAGPCLEYQMYLFSTGEARVQGILSPTLNFAPDRGLRYAVSFDDGPAQVVTAVPARFSAQNGNADWERTVRDSARITVSTHAIAAPGYHTLKIWMVDPGIVVQKLVVDFGGAKSSYLGPPESYRGGK